MGRSEGYDYELFIKINKVYIVRFFHNKKHKKQYGNSSKKQLDKQDKSI